MKKTYRVVASQLVYHESFIEADSGEEAQEIAWSGESDWKEFHYGDWELEDVELTKERA